MGVVDNYNIILNQLNSAAEKAGHKAELLAVSKNQEVSKMEKLAAANVLLFGESKVQEAVPKIEYLTGKYSNLSFHYIGKLQSNKLKKIVEYFSLIHSVDREDFLELIDKYALMFNKKQEILIQLNIAHEKQKNGIDPYSLDNMLKKAWQFKNIIVKGIMFMPPYEEDVSKNIKYFQQAHNIFNKYRDNVFNVLSMGMSHDFQEAVMYGATLVRVGTNIFGERA